MKTRESSLWKWLRKISDSEELVMHRIENSVASGTPDVLICYRGISAVVELKDLESLSDIENAVTTAQAMFLAHWHWAGGSSYLLVRVRQKLYMFRGNLPLGLADDPPSKVHDVAYFINRRSLISTKATRQEILDTIISDRAHRLRMCEATRKRIFEQ